MALDHALLVSLLEKPSSGYELARRFDRSIGYFWHATHQQIYRVLARMEASGWISGEVQAGETAPDRKVFSVTGPGREELSRWLGQPAEPDGVRDTLMVKLRGAAFDDPARLLPEFERHRAAHADRLSRYRAIESRDFAGAQSASPAMPSSGAQGASLGVDGRRSASPATQSDSTVTLERQQALQHLVLKSGIRYEQAWLEWCEESMSLLRSFNQSQSTRTTP